MLDPKVIRQNPKEVQKKTKLRGNDFDVTKFDALDAMRKDLQIKLQTLQNERNNRAKAVGMAKAKGEDIQVILSEVKDIGEELNSVQAKFEQVQVDLHDLLAIVPNLPHDSVPHGKDENDNVVDRTWGTPRQFDFEPKDHTDLGAKLGMDFKAATKISGSRFVLLQGQLARLQRAIADFMLDLHINEHDYQEVYVPYIVNAETLYGSGQLPKLKEDLFALNSEHEFYLIPTSEAPLANIYRDEIVDSKELPIKLVCKSACFRSEAGSYGKDTKGMIRQHQFEKVELVQLVHPDNSYKALEELTGHAEKVLQLLELPYRVVSLCTGDLGFSAAKTYDLEVWLPGQDKYREISSCSNTENFQARRMKARFRDNTTSDKPELLHTLNGSGLAVGRTLVAILENYQDKDGNINIPKVLQKYMNNLEVIKV